MAFVSTNAPTSKVDAEWQRQWIQHVSDISSDVSIEESAARMRKLVASKLLKYTDVRDDPARFFLAYRLIVDPRKRGPGVGIRLTVQYNLFAGTAFGLETEQHIKILDEMQEKGQLGCFALTEKFAGKYNASKSIYRAI
jgi:acyl-CoA oxidase